MKILFVTLLLLVGISAKPLSNMNKDIKSKEDKVYKYKAETPLVKGWPEPTNYNEVIVKTLPLHMVAYTQGSRKSLTFMRLFKQIKKQEVAMTSPVIMKIPSKIKDTKMKEMAFIYPDSFQGGSENVKKVSVREENPQEVYSYVWQGCSCKKKQKRAKEALYDYAQLTGAQLSNFRVLGYNSPSVPDEEKTWEMIASFD